MKPGDLVSAKYRLLRRLGEGGMAEVWAATNVVTQREFAVKLILPSLAGNGEALERFFQEAKAAGRVRHPSIVDVFDVGRTPEGRPFLVMELLAGESLEARLARRGRLSALTTAVWLSQIARGLHLAHKAGVVHRDLSTANIFLSVQPDGGEPVPKILDFGVSKILTPGHDGRVRTGNGAVLGSPAYMSPEQARGAENVDARTDVWSLGVLMYECLSGRPPFSAGNYNALMLAIISSPHRSIGSVVVGIDPDVEGVVESCLIKDRDARTQTALEVAEQLEGVARRLASGAGLEVRGPQRRATDRIPRDEGRVTPTSLPRAARLPGRTFPMGVRCWQLITRSAPPGGLMVGGALGGTAVGLAIGVTVATTRPAEPQPSEPLRAAMATARPAAEEVAAAVASAPELAPGKAPESVDLVGATARALGLEKKSRRRAATAKTAKKPQGPVVAVAPRKNPY